MKKRISLLLAVVMVLGSFASVFATDASLTQEEAESAKFLEENGILIGNSGGLLLDKELIRQDSVILLSRLLGEEDEAKNHPITNAIKKFKDLPNDNYYKRNISWAVEEEYYEGTSNTTFSPRRALRVEEYATVLMRALGHSEENWRNNYDKAVELGILENVNVEGPEQNILRKDVAVMTYNALGVKIKGSDVTLAQSLGIVMPEEPVVPEADEWELRIDAPKALKADGIATGVVNFGLYKNGKLDTSANKVVLDVNTTYGSLSQKRVTIQNGEAQLILRSEFQDKPVIARIDAIIIEAEGEHKDLIGKVVAKPAAVEFNHEGKQEETQIKHLLQANSNEADRVTLIFDKPVNMFDFYEMDDNTGGLKIIENEPVLKGSLDNDGKETKLEDRPLVISQNGKAKAIEAVLFDKNNPNIAVVVLNKNSVLTDNKDVDVKAEINKYDSGSKATFKLTDARRPNMTSVKAVNNRKIEVSFSEPIHSAEFVIDGRAQEGKDFTVIPGEVTFNIAKGEFEDQRHVFTLELNKDFKDPNDKDKKIPAGYFKPGMHSVQASKIKDFAALTDVNNIGTTQSLSFKVEEDKTKTDAEVIVESPEQFRVIFNNEVIFKNDKDLEDYLKLQVRNPEAKTEEEEWRSLSEHGLSFKDKEDLVVTEIVEGREYKVELAKDWTEIYNTKEKNLNYYNNRFRLVIEKDSVITVSNGLKNKDQMILNLSESGSLLTKPDTVSPSILDVTKLSDNTFDVEMSEPVKLKGHSKHETLAQTQEKLPTTMVDFIGRDKDGHIVTLSGEVNGYSDSDTKKTDRFINVTWLTKDKDGKKLTTPQDIVNDGGSEDWTIVVKAISDDVGNVAATVTKEFKLKPITSTSVFRVAQGTEEDKAVGEDGKTSNFLVEGNNDEVTVQFTKDVSVVGINAATDVKNYTLNGRDLPAGTKILLAKDSDSTIKIILPEGTLQESNVLVLAEQIESKDGGKLVGDRAFTFIAKDIKEARLEKEAAEKAVTDAKAELDEAEGKVEAAEAELETAEEKVTAAQTKLDEAKGKETAAQTKLDEAKGKETAAQTKLDEAKQAVTDAGEEATEQQKQAVTAAEAELETAKQAVTAAEAELETAKQAVTAAEAELETAEKAVTAAEAELETAKKAVTDAKAELDEAEKELAKLK